MDDDGLIVLGADDAPARRLRAAETYATSLRPPVAGKPLLFARGRSMPEPLLDELFAGLHLVRFRLTAGAKSALHTHDCEQILIVISGTPYIATREETFTLRAGSVVLIPAGEPHIHGNSEESGAETVVFTRTGHGTDFVE